MKTVEMFRDFDYSPTRALTVRFVAGVTYLRVLETAARLIERNGAGRIVIAPHGSDGAAGSTVDARNAFKRRR